MEYAPFSPVPIFPNGTVMFPVSKLYDMLPRNRLKPVKYIGRRLLARTTLSRSISFCTVSTTRLLSVVLLDNLSFGCIAHPAKMPARLIVKHIFHITCLVVFMASPVLVEVGVENALIHEV